MTEAELLTAVNSHAEHLGEESSKFFLPDIYAFIDPCLYSLARRVAKSKDLSNSLLKTFSIVITANVSGNLYTAAIPVDLLSNPPFRDVSIGESYPFLYNPNSLRISDCSDNLPADYYSVVGELLQLLTEEDVTVSTTNVSVTGIFVPTLSTLPADLEGQFVDEMLIRLGVIRNEGARVNG